MNLRTISVEMTGDHFHRKIKPAMRLKGRWLKTIEFPVTPFCTARTGQLLTRRPRDRRMPFSSKHNHPNE